MDIHLSHIVMYLSGQRYEAVDFTSYSQEETGPVRTMTVPGNYVQARHGLYYAVTDYATRKQVHDVMVQSQNLIDQLGTDGQCKDSMVLEARMAWAHTLLHGRIKESIIKQLPFLSGVVLNGALDFPFAAHENEKAFVTLLEKTERLMELNGGNAWVQLRIDHNIGNLVMDELRRMSFLGQESCDNVYRLPTRSSHIGFERR